MPVDVNDFRKNLHGFKDELVRLGKAAGPVFSGEGSPQLWYDQLFESEFEPAGSVDCSKPLRVGKTHSSLDIVIVASASNEGKVIIPAGSTITMRFLQSDSERGTYEDVGPEICVKAPVGGKQVEPGGLIARFAAGDFKKPWLMVACEFAGSITGGKVDCGLAYMPR